MKRLLLLILAAPLSVHADSTVEAQLNYDNTVDLAYRAGNKPVSGGACPTGWTCATIGDGTEDIDEVSATEFLMVGSGSNDETDFAYVYKTSATDEDQRIYARVGEFSGYIEAHTSAGCGLVDNAGWRFHVRMRTDPTDVANAKFDAGGAGETSTNGLANQSLPRYVDCRYDDSATGVSAFESSDGVSWTQIGTTVTKSLTFPVNRYLFVTSHHPTSTTTVTLDNISEGTTLPGGGAGNGPPNDAPVWNATPVVNCTAGTASSVSIANAANTTDTGEYASDADADALTFTSQGTAPPTGVTIDNTNYEIDCGTDTSAGTTNGVVIGADDGTAARVDSSSFSIVIAAAGGGGGDATLLWTGDFETGAASIQNGGQYKTKIARQGQVTVVTSSDGGQCEPRQGTYMGRAEITAGASGTPQRAEVKSTPGQFIEWEDGQTYWTGLSFCVENWSGTVNTLVQWHAPNESGQQCDMAGNLIGNHNNGRVEIIDNPGGASEGSGANSNHVTVYDLNLASASNQDVWHDFVYAMKVNTDRTGVRANCNGTFRLWHQGTQVYNQTGLCNVNYKDECGTTITAPQNRSNGLHFGLYQGNTTNRVFYMDAARFAVGDSGYDTVNPAQ